MIDEKRVTKKVLRLVKVLQSTDSLNITAMSCQELLLVRHCQSTGQCPEAPLTEDGVRQSRHLNNVLADYPIDFIAASEFLRARQTIQALADQSNLDVHIDHRLNERTLSAEPVENWQEFVRDSFSDYDLHAPGGETAREVLRRAWAALDEVLNENHNLPLVVTHGNLMALVLHSIDRSFGYDGWRSLSNPDVYVLRRNDRGQFGFKRVWREIE